jgi:mono/diheme cytochrome c family protein
MLWLALLAAGLLAGCRQDMHDQPKYIPLRESAFFGDLRSERPLPDGTVPRGYLRDDTYLYTGKINGQDGTVFPFAITAADLRRGQERYNIYCAPCHSPLGDGRGAVPVRGFSKLPPAYTDATMLDGKVGHYFDVMSNGFGIMQDYSAQVSVPDRWRIAAYIRVLQLSQHAALADVPEEERGKLNESSEAGAQTGPERGQKQ